MPTQPCVIRPRRSTSVISTNTSPAPEFASMPRCVMCQSPITPSAALYWHIGATLMRLASSRPLILYGENSALVMNDARWWGECGKKRGINGGEAGSSQSRHRERQRLCARDERVDHQIFVRRMRLAAHRADRADRRRPDTGRKTGIRAAAGEFSLNLQRKIARAGRIVVQQALVLGTLDQRFELPRDLERRARARHIAGRHDALDLRHRGFAIRWR